MLEHMKKHADIIRPKFEAVLEMLDKELGDLGIAKWTKPNGGYFIGFDTMDGCAKKVVAMCKEAGVVMTPAVQHIRMEKILTIQISVLHRHSRQQKN